MPFVCAKCRARFTGAPKLCPLDGSPLEFLDDEQFVDISLVERASRSSLGAHWVAIDAWRGWVRAHVLQLPFERPPGFLRWLNEEASAIARIGHPAWEAPTEIRETDDGRVVLLYAAAPVVGWPEYLTQAWPGRVPVERAIALGALLLDAFVAAERARYVHGGLKPLRLGLRVDADGRLSLRVSAPSLWKALTLVDLRAPRFHSGVDPFSGYESPETLFGVARGLAADHWALAAIAYEMLTGRRPFELHPLVGLRERLAAGALRPVRELRPDTPPALAAIVDRALSLDPAARFASAEALRLAWSAL